MNEKILLKQVSQLKNKARISDWHKIFTDSVKPSEQEKLTVFLDEGFKGKSLTKKEIAYPAELRISRYKNILVRFLATELNNLVITLGTSQIGLEGPLANEARLYIEKNLSHLLNQIEENFDGKSKIKIGRLKKSLKFKQSSLNPKNKISGPRLGIDVGGTSVNLVLVDGGQIIQSVSLPSFQENETFSQFINRLILKIQNNSWQKKFQGIGIAWIGDARNGRPLRNSAWLQKLANQNNLMEKFPRVMSKKLGVPVGVWGDIEAIGCYYGQSNKAKNCWLIRIGTSVGGAYLDATGRFDTGFHLVSRVIINMSKNALKHNATGVRGMTQQYVGSFAFKKLLADEKINLPAGTGPGEVLQKLLAGSVKNKKIALKITAHYAQDLNELIKELAGLYQVNAIILSGSPVTGLLGKKVISSVKQNLIKDGLKLKIEQNDLPQKYAGALAVAELLRL